MKQILKCAILVCAVLLQTSLFTSCSKSENKTDAARVDAAVLAQLGGIMAGDYDDALRMLEVKSAYMRTDVFGNDHVFKEREAALNYLASANNATLEVMDSLAMNIEVAAKEEPDNANLAKLGTLARKFVSVCKNPAAQGDDLSATCKSISDAIAQTLAEGGAPDADKVELQTGLAGNAIMQREIAAVQLAEKRNGEAAKRNREQGDAFLKENAGKAGVTSLPSGLQYRVIKSGTGAVPTDESQVTVTYEGRFIDGTVFDGTKQSNGGKPVTLGMRSVVRGWNEALKLMKAGSEWEIFMPCDLGYGPDGADDVPPGAALIFTIKLVSVK